MNSPHHPLLHLKDINPDDEEWEHIDRRESKLHDLIKNAMINGLLPIGDKKVSEWTIKDISTYIRREDVFEIWLAFYLTSHNRAEYLEERKPKVIYDFDPEYTMDSFYSYAEDLDSATDTASDTDNIAHVQAPEYVDTSPEKDNYNSFYLSQRSVYANHHLLYTYLGA